MSSNVRQLSTNPVGGHAANRQMSAIRWVRSNGKRLVRFQLTLGFVRSIFLLLVTCLLLCLPSSDMFPLLILVITFGFAMFFLCVVSILYFIRVVPHICFVYLTYHVNFHLHVSSSFPSSSYSAFCSHTDPSLRISILFILLIFLPLRLCIPHIIPLKHLPLFV